MRAGGDDVCRPVDPSRLRQSCSSWDRRHKYLASGHQCPHRVLPPIGAPERPGEPFDAERARRDTPGTRHVVHLNHAGASLMPRPVLDAVQAHLNLEAEIGGMEAWTRSAFCTSTGFLLATVKVTMPHLTWPRSRTVTCSRRHSRAPQHHADVAVAPCTPLHATEIGSRSCARCRNAGHRRLTTRLPATKAYEGFFLSLARVRFGVSIHAFFSSRRTREHPESSSQSV
jgi:hypothetical protein